jgi:hypothetical protein
VGGWGGMLRSPAPSFWYGESYVCRTEALSVQDQRPMASTSPVGGQAVDHVVTWAGRVKLAPVLEGWRMVAFCAVMSPSAEGESSLEVLSSADS